MYVNTITTPPFKLLRALQGKTQSQASQGDQKQLFFFFLQRNICAAPAAL